MSAGTLGGRELVIGMPPNKALQLTTFVGRPSASLWHSQLNAGYVGRTGSRAAGFSGCNLPIGGKRVAFSNKDLQNHKFLAGMYSDGYFPPFLVDKCKAILVRLCESIEREQPKDPSALCVLTHAATEE